MIILFGWLGALGLFIGYFTSGVLIREFAIDVALALGLISALTPLLAFGLWKRLTGLSSYFKKVSLGAIVALVFLYSGLTAIVRWTYHYNTDYAASLALILVDFLSNAVGALLFLYLLRLGNRVSKFTKRGL